MSLPEDQVAVLLAEVSAEFSERHQHIRKIFLERFEQVCETAGARVEEVSEPTAAVDRLLFPGRILLGIRCAVQSLHRPAPRSNGAASRRLAFHSQPARYRGRAHFFHHFSNRHYPSRSSDRGLQTQRLPHRAAPDSKPGVRKGVVRAETRGTGIDRRDHSPGDATSWGSRSRWRSFAPVFRPSSSGCRMEWRRKIKTPPRESGCWPAPTTRSSSSRSRSCPNASCSQPRPRSATASRMRVSSISRTRTASTGITRLSPPTTAGS